MFPLWDDEVEDKKADNIIEAIFSSGWSWNQAHWPDTGTKLWTSVKVEYKKVKTSKRSLCSAPTESEEESPRKKARVSPGQDTLNAEIKVWLTAMASSMVEGLGRWPHD
ncbi:Uncharacterized protein Rs2_46900 [Raphanus sativus]|nr:Uncharacterized protein Rs2_52414 [Raphanus sativus]KAJ4871457.1 Uncharacterized protein Rs2_46900 [Raphanus sativus]